MELSELIACTLSDTDLKSQQERWLALGENFGLGRQETKDGLRLSFRSHPAIRKELEALVAVERECCSWAAWNVDDDGDGDALVMAARSQGTGVTTLHGMFMQLAWPSSGQPPSRRWCSPTRSRAGTGSSSGSLPQAVPLRARTAS